ncbi:MAG TPA: biotin/lipoate A/B protein ligase family protein [Thermodesulfovibrionales bacterium]|nr:biotin/lipoate A/B protein ligase family protein [Thermodesulfovibrionales bacterium]
MKQSWRLIDSGAGSASFNMALDEAIALSVRKKDAPPTLRLYCWDRPAVSLGCFQRSTDLDLPYCERNNIPVVRRPTGGRAILHGNELTYSFSVRTDFAPFAGGLMESYRCISRAFSDAFKRIGLSVATKTRREKGRVLTRSPLCFASSSYGEILVGNSKLVGSAQKRWKDGLLQQGSVPYAYDEETMRHIFGSAGTLQDSCGMVSLRDVMPDIDGSELKRAIAQSFEEVFGISLPASQPSPEEFLLARELEEQKYLQGSWNLRL